MILGYIRVSTDTQDLENQRNAILRFAQSQKLMIDDFIEVTISSRKSKAERKIDVVERLGPEDRLIVTELSRLGRNMIETLNLVTRLNERMTKIDFVMQPELSTTAPHGKLMLAIYSYFAEAERDFISARTKAGLEAARAKGKQIGRPKGRRNKNPKLLPYRDDIKRYLGKGLDLGTIRKVINAEHGVSFSYNTYKYFIEITPELRQLKIPV